MYVVNSNILFTCMEFLRLLCDLQRSEGNKNVLYVFVCFLTFTPVAPSLPGGPSDPGLPWRQTEQMSEIWSWYGCIIYIGGIWTSLQIYFWVRWIQSSFALFFSCMCFLPHVQSRQQVQSIQEVQQGQEVHGHQKNQMLPVCQAHPEVQIISVRLGT